MRRLPSAAARRPAPGVATLPPGLRSLPVLAAALVAAPLVGGANGEAWPVCDNRAYRDEDIEPGGLRLLGVKESPLGAFPQVAAAETLEHFFQQLREVWTDDCPRIMVQLGVQPAAGPFRTISSSSLWLHYFNHSGVVLVVDAVDDYLQHFADTLDASPLASVASLDDGGAGQAGPVPGRVSVQTVRSAIVPETKGAKAKERPVSFDGPGGGKVLASEEVMHACSPGAADPDAKDERHPCARILRRMASPEPLEYRAPGAPFDELWRLHLSGRHVDFLHVNIGSAGMFELLRKGFSKLFEAREVSVMAFRVDKSWTKAELQKVVEWLDKFEYFSSFQLVCMDSSQAGSFEYIGPTAGPTTYLPLSGIDIAAAIDWERLALPQDVLVFDLRQPDIFRTVQLGDVQCDAGELSDETETCAADGSGDCASSSKPRGPPKPPAGLRVVRSESRSLTLEWRADAGGAQPETYELRVDPGAMEDTLDHDIYDVANGLQMHTIGSLRPSTRYTIRLRAVSASGQESEEALVSHRTESEQAAAAVGALYDLIEGLHCGMSTAEEVSPPGPPPDGASFFRDITDTEGCRARCDDNRQCLAFQVKVGDACWLYRRRPSEARLSGPRGSDVGWFCGVRKAER